MVTKKITECIQETGAPKFFVLICNPRTYNLPLRNIAFTISILLLRSKLSSWPSLGICEQNETRKPNRAEIIFVDYKVLLSLEVSNPNICRLEAVANQSVLSVFWVDVLWDCPTWSDIVLGCKVHWIWWGKCCVHIHCMCFLISIEIHWFV